MRFLHLGDLHIGKRVHERLMIDEQRHAFGQIVAAAKEHQVDAVLIAGDVFDKPVPSKEALELSEELFAGFLSAGIPAYMIPGNHDSAQQVAYCSTITEAAGLHVAKAFAGPIPTYRLEEAGMPPVDIHLLPFVRPTDVRMAFPERADEISTHDDAVRVALEEHELDLAARNVLVAHQFVVDGQKAPETCESETVSVGGIDSVQAALFDQFDYVALGHIHGAQKVRRPEVRYCGSPVKYSFSEAAHQKAACIVELGGADGREVSITQVPLSPIHEMREVTAAFDDLQAGCDTGNHQDYMHVILTDRSVFDAQQRLRAIYPNLLHMSWADTYTPAGAQGLTLQHLQEKGELELFEDFYQAQVGQEMLEGERQMLQDVIANAKGEC